jgi:hypothetical protein
MVDVGTVAVNAALMIAWGLALGLYIKGRFDRLFKFLDASQQRWEERQRLWEENHGGEGLRVASPPTRGPSTQVPDARMTP